jgi:protein-S-isoprenylcysteine O-methyltransferase Ste14
MKFQEIYFRLIFAVVLVAVFSISASFRRRARVTGGVIQRQEEGVLVLVLRMSLALPLLISLLLFIFLPNALAWSRIPVPAWLRVVAAILAMLCVPMIWWVFRSIGENISETVLIKRTHRLVMHGPYRWVRHPLYAVSLMLLLAFAILASSWFLGAYWLLALIVFRVLVIPSEEKNLIEAFGEAYLAYQKRTGVLLPKFPS